MRSAIRFNDDVVITAGFRNDPHLDLLEESTWSLSVELDPEQSLTETALVAAGFGGWMTVFDPPWPFGPDEVELRPEWRVYQWRENEEGDQVDRALRPIGVEELVEVVPSRFKNWMWEVTEEAINALDAITPELDLDQGRALVSDVQRLKASLRDARDKRSISLRRTYGRIFIYDFPPELDLHWQIERVVSGLEALVVQPVNASAPGGRLALLPPEEHWPWRWTDPERPDDGGFLLTPGEAMGRVPADLRWWVAARTHGALQEARGQLAALARRGFADADDLRQLALVAGRAQELAAAGGREMAIHGLVSEDMPDDAEIVAEMRSPDGRIVILHASTWNHILRYHPEMEGRLENLVDTLERPELREPDPRVGRERYFRRAGPQAWVRVVVEFSGTHDRVVTAFPQSNIPEGWRRP